MQWNDRAIVLSARRLGEHSAIVHLLTSERGLYAGVDRGAFGRRKRGVYQAGNIVSARWHARLSEHLGMVDCELLEPVAAHLLDDRRRLAALNSALLLTPEILADRQAEPRVYARAEEFVRLLRKGGDWLDAYVRYEFTLLDHAGFGLDLGRCAATGQAHDLAYVSPKSGRAVSREAGEPYRQRLLKLPQFLLEEARSLAVELAHILDGVRLCGYFLEERVFAPRGLSMPSARERFIRMLEKEPLGEVVG